MAAPRLVSFPALALLGVLQVAAGGAVAVPLLHFSFSQSGFSGGAVIGGTFSGMDGDGDGWLSSFAGEITAYTMSFSGNAIVGAFSHGIGEFVHAGAAGGLVYRLGSPTLGDDTGLPIEGISSGALSGSLPPPPPSASQYAYRMGLGPTGMSVQPFGFVEDNTPLGLANPLGNTDINTTAFVLVSQIVSMPEPRTVLLLAAGLLAAVAARSRRRHAPA